MSENEQIIVLVQDSGDVGHGEISVLDNWEKAERLIETLLEAGFEGERIQVFRGQQNEFKISHRPVVSFGAGTAQRSQAKAPVTVPKSSEPASEPTPAAVAPKAAEEPSPPRKQAEPAEEPQPSTEPEPVAQAEDAPQTEPPADEEQPSAEGEAEPVEAGSVRFSSLFRSA